MQKTGALYIVATPIGNLEDITLRAIRILNEVDIILAEDTRITRKLISSLNFQFPITNEKCPPGSDIASKDSLKNKKPPYPISHIPYTKLQSYHQHSKEEKKLWILKELNDGKKIALVADAGTPGISDPGNELISFLLEKNPKIKIVPIPGPSAVITALSILGFNVNKFVFIGFMPKKKKKKLLRWLIEGGIPFAYYDSPHRLLKNLETIEEFFGSDIKIVVARELTKLHETVYRGNIAEVGDSLKKEKLKGEVVVTIGVR